jgi:hypothetical protein
MNPSQPLTVKELLDNRSLVATALARGVYDALLRHAQAGHPVATWREGKVVWVQPDEIFALLATMREQYPINHPAPTEGSS